MNRFFLLALLLLTGNFLQIANAEGNNTSVNQRLLITVVNDGREEAAVLRTFNRNYVAPKTYDSALLAKRRISDIIREYSLVEQGGWQINSLAVYCALVAVPQGQSTEQVIALLQSDTRVESVQPLLDYDVQNNEQSGGLSYNDPYFDIQYKTLGSKITEMHESSIGRGVKVAIIDTGADINHPDLKGQINTVRNFVDDNQKQFQADIHGTAIAGIIAAKADNAVGIVGLAPGADISVLKACWQLQAQGSVAKCNSFTLANAISHAIDNRARIINVSLSGPRDPLVARLVDAALRRGSIVVASDPGQGGNRYPAQLPGVIAVRQSEPESDQSTSNPTDKNFSIVVNGSEVLSTGPGGGFDFFSGSSMSAATVTGYIALMVETDPDWSQENLADIRSEVNLIAQ